MRPLLLTIPFLCAVTLSAQTTTWTSFEERTGHAIASAASSILMFGGTSVTNGSVLDDTSSLQSSGWQARQPATRPEARSGHAMIATQDVLGADVFVLFGGNDGNGNPTGTTWTTIDGGGWDPRGNNIAMRRSGHAMAADLTTRLVYMFGGSGSLPLLADTWRFDPDSFLWTQVVPQGAPPARRGHCMAHDLATGRIYLFGGLGFAGRLNDLWAFDPTAVPPTWTNVTPATSPPARSEAAMALLLGSGLVVFGGRDANLQALSDTWTYNASTGQWAQATPAHTPPARFGHAMAARNNFAEIVMVGGTDAAGQPLRITWKWTGVGAGLDWFELTTPAPPREAPALAFDSQASPAAKAVLFGGRQSGGGADLGDTWQLEGLRWTQSNLTIAPSPRSDAGMTYDSARNRTVLYGGRVGGACGTDLGDTWEWNGSTWSPRLPTASPPAAGGTQMVFDSKRAKAWMLVGTRMWSFDGSTWRGVHRPLPRGWFGGDWDTARGRLVVVGGRGLGGTALADTWEWDGSWHDRTLTGQGPADRLGNALAYDPVNHVAISYGGDSTSQVELNDTWSWNGSSWALSGGLSFGRNVVAMAFDAGRGRMVLFGGYSGPGGGVLNETWEHQLAGWSQVLPANSPGRRAGMQMAYDPVHGVVVLFAGENQVLGSPADTWEFNGSNWTQRSPATSPPSRSYGHFTYDVHTNRMLLFGGRTPNLGLPMFNDTWLWDGTTWTNATPAQSPAGRYAGCIFSTGTRTILYSGNQGDPGIPVDEMLEWDGANWSTIELGIGELPAPRTNYGAAYDKRRDRVVVFGGMSNCSRATAAYFDETWEWDGDNWVQRLPAHKPSPRRCKLAYDEARGRVVLFGGSDANFVFQETWEWDGTDWRQMTPVATAPGSNLHAAIYDSAQRQTILFGPFGAWDYRPLHPGTIESIGAGCVGSAGTPTLAPLPWTGPWLGDTVEIDIQNRPPGPMLFVWGAQRQDPPFNLGPLGSPQCNVYESFDLQDVFPLGETRYVSAPVPNAPYLLGVVYYGQAGFLDLGLPNAPPVVSNAIKATIGAK